ncbi:DUF3316 domain-containing protein [Parabacteroides sp. FAFU027]|uniref:DUF3316 domain-containing protein n=1 Tax=Parabacteroides sp. FAFU027 TaxID=2922715 RepID=UPI001FB04778|nr:DUF3316 domain-containing protein [Parabacteroides sp. FAFU027]
MTYYRICLAILLTVCLSRTSYSQESENGKLQTRTLLFGLGQSSVIETYLSPYKYTGINYRLDFSLDKDSKDGLVTWQHDINLDYAHASNYSDRGLYHTAFLDYTFSYLRKVVSTDKFHAKIGLAPDFLLGVVYNNRNDNNPAEAKVNLNLDFAGRLDYRFRWKQTPILLSYDLRMPVLGAGFSPDYGQSYYEIFELGNRSNIVHLLSLHNQWTFNNKLTMELPVGKYSLKFGYLFNLYQTRISNIETSVMNHNLLIGISGDILHLSRKKHLQGKSF